MVLAALLLDGMSTGVQLTTKAMGLIFRNLWLINWGNRMGTDKENAAIEYNKDFLISPK